MLDASLIFDGTVSGAGVVSGTAVTATRVSTNVIDLLVARDIGVGDMLEIHVAVTTAFVQTDTTTATLQIDFETCSTAGGSYDIVELSPAYTTASLVIGAKIFRYKLPIMDQLKASGPKQFIRLNYTVAGGGSYSAGAVAAWISAGGDRNAYFNYPSNFTVASGS